MLVSLPSCLKFLIVSCFMCVISIGSRKAFFCLVIKKIKNRCICLLIVKGRRKTENTKDTNTYLEVTSQELNLTEGTNVNT